MSEKILFVHEEPNLINSHKVILEGIDENLDVRGLTYEEISSNPKIIETATIIIVGALTNTIIPMLLNFNDPEKNKNLIIYSDAILHFPQTQTVSKTSPGGPQALLDAVQKVVNSRK